MRLFFNFLLIALFFVTYKIYGFYWATGVLMLASFGQTVFIKIMHQKIQPADWLSFLIIQVFGATTLILHNEIYIKLKLTVFDWVVAILFLYTQFMTERPLIQKIMDNKLSLPTTAWKKLNLAWIMFFVSMGLLNLYVVYNFPTDIWVNFKLFGTVGLTAVFIVLQSFYMIRCLKNDTIEAKNK